MKGKPDYDIKTVEINGIRECVPDAIAEKINRFFVDSIVDINNIIPDATYHINQTEACCEFKFKSSRIAIEKYLSPMKKKRDANFINPQICMDSMPVSDPPIAIE